ncbi:hypothetical protein P378_17745 [Desulforamulus profundi]|uniref:DegV family protein n=1 Tax=Desulforamulus profundi TaxID=1383067 RepID=A0A2C6MCH5_9FIRM|nr:hypothetical protein P378_17745 [Desulforamulus profundi]
MKGKVAIVTDSTCDLDQEVIREYDIRVLPLKVIYPNNEEYLDRTETSPRQIYERMPEEIPSTSLPRHKLWSCLKSSRQMVLLMSFLFIFPAG